LVAAGGGTVDTSGSPANTYLARFTDADTISGDSNITWSGTVLAITGGMSLSTATVNFTGLGDDDTEDHVVAIDDSTGLLSKRSVASLGSSMVYPGAGIALSTGSAWDTSITNNSANWDTAYGWGDHDGLYANLSHTHGNITNAGAIGSTTNLPIITTTAGVLIASSFGTGANTFCEGDDSRLSDARTPTSHTLLSHTISGETLGHVLAADSASTYSIRQLLGSEINNDSGWTSNTGTVDTSGSPANTYLARFTDADTITGDTNITWSGTVLAITGGMSLSTATVNFTGLGDDDTEDHVIAIDDSTGLLSKRSVASLGSGMVYPGAGIALSTGSAWGTSITNNSANWNTAYGWGDHDGLYAAASHAHGNITNAGAIGSTTNLPIITTTAGVLIASSFGSGANTFCEGDDSRLSDARTPTSHTLLSHTISGETTGHVLAADSATTFSIRELLGSEINNDSGWTTNTGTVDTTGTPADGQVAVWTDPDTLEGDADLTFDTSTNTLMMGVITGNSVMVGNDTTPGIAVQTEDAHANVTRVIYSNTASWDAVDINSRYGGTIASPAAAPTSAIVKEEIFSVYDGTALRSAGGTTFEVDGAIATDDFDTKYTWSLKVGAAASAEKLSLDSTGLTIADGLQLGGAAVNFTALGDDDTEDHVIAIDDSTGLLSKRSVASLGAGGGGDVFVSGTPANDYLAVWTDDETIEGPSTLRYVSGQLRLSGGGIRIPQESAIYFNGATETTYIDTSAAGLLRFYAGGVFHFSLNATDLQMASGMDITAGGSKNSNIGSTGAFFDNVYVDRLYVDDTSTYIDIDSGDMTFTDTNSGTVTLATLAAGGSTDVQMAVLNKTSSASQDVGGAAATVVWWSWDGQELIDTADFTHSTVTNNTRLAVDTAGWYEVIFVGGAQNAGGGRVTLRPCYRVNGGTTLFKGGARNYGRGSGYGNVSVMLHIVIELDADDYVEVGTEVAVTEGTYTMYTDSSNTSGEIDDEEHTFIMKKLT